MKIKEIGYEYEAPLNRELWQKCQDLSTNSLFHNAICLRSGRDALKAAAREYEPTVALLPSLACDSMVLPFKLFNHRVIFYKLQNDFSIDTNDLLEKLSSFKNNKSILLLYMNYFGNEAMPLKELNKLKENFSNLIFINDITQTFFVKEKTDFIPHYVIASLRKWIAIPDGGLLWNNIPLRYSSFLNDNRFFNKRLSAQNMRYEFLENGDLSLKPEFRHIFSTVSDIIDESSEIARMSEYSYQLAKKENLDEISRKRTKNAQVLIKELGGEVSFIQKDANKCNLYVGVLIEDRNRVQAELAKEGIFSTIIWPLSDEQKKTDDFAKYVEEHMLAIYCDQRYNEDDMKYVASEIKRIIHG